MGTGSLSSGSSTGRSILLPTLFACLACNRAALLFWYRPGRFKSSLSGWWHGASSLSGWWHDASSFKNPHNSWYYFRFSLNFMYTLSYICIVSSELRIGEAPIFIFALGPGTCYASPSHAVWHALQFVLYLQRQFIEDTTHRKSSVTARRPVSYLICPVFRPCPDESPSFMFVIVFVSTSRQTRDKT
jgi:hypothetical protein